MEPNRITKITKITKNWFKRKVFIINDYKMEQLTIII